MGILSGVKNFLFGGESTSRMPQRGEHADYLGGYLQNALAGVDQRQAPAFMSPEQQQARLQQMQLAQQLRQTSSGQQAGAGELAVGRQIGQAQAAQQGMSQAARGQNSALAARLAARNVADIGVAGAGQAAQAQMQDQAAAQAQLANLLGVTRGQDITIGQGNQQAQLSQTQLNQQAQLGYLAQLLGVDEQTLQAQLAKEKVAQGDKGIIGSLIQAGGNILTAKAGGGT